MARYLGVEVGVPMNANSKCRVLSTCWVYLARGYLEWPGSRELACLCQQTNNNNVRLIQPITLPCICMQGNEASECGHVLAWSPYMASLHCIKMVDNTNVKWEKKWRIDLFWSLLGAHSYIIVFLDCHVHPMNSNCLTYVVNVLSSKILTGQTDWWTKPIG